MHLSSALLGLAVLLAPAATAIKVRVFETDSCSGKSQEVNVWDNTCATWMMGFQSFEVLAYGGGGQTLHAYSRNACVVPTTYRGYADGQGLPHGTALKGECHKAINGDGGSNALGSFM